MDTDDPQVRRELQRRLDVIAATETADPARGPLPRADLAALLAIVVVSVLLGLVVGL